MKVNAASRIKRDLIAGLDERRAEARSFVESLPPLLRVHAESGWTARDLVIHMTAIEKDMIRAMQSAIDGKAFSVGLRGQATVVELYELRRRESAAESWEALLAEWERARNQLRGLILAFPAALMQKRFSTPFFQDYNLAEAVQACCAHEGLHIGEMRAALEGS